MNLAAVAYIMGLLTAGLGSFMLLPGLAGVYFGDKDGTQFMVCGLMVLALGGLLVVMNKDRELELGHREGFLITFLSWAGLSILAAWPLYVTHAAPTWADAWFEAVSGLTTTGATIMTGLDAKGHGVLLWRSLLQWLGGMGIVVLAVAVLPFLGVGGMQMYRSELPGVTKDKLQPRLRQTAQALWLVYFVFTALCGGLYWLGGMNGFDAVCHAMTTLSSGGFSTHDASFGYFAGNVFLEGVCMVFMLAAAVNFTLHYRLFSGWGAKAYNDIELKVMLAVIGGAALCIALVLALEGLLPFGHGLWLGAYNVISLISTTGFTNVDYSQWPVGLVIGLLVLMFMGGCSGSTSGGMKVLRIWVIVQEGRQELFRLLHPFAVRPVKVGKAVVSPVVMQAVAAYAGLYILTFAVVSVLVAATGVDIVTAFSTSIATLGNVGPALGEAGPAGNFAGLPQAAKVILTWAMLLGRLELYTVILVFVPRFWRP
ncbi:MAG: hypothetical protein H6922_01570 [Pseudomonadaceae bacterium]|nr:hypothetical protein [Pseudomonadaceae bacterium]